MTDKELLELAAKAAGIRLHEWQDGMQPGYLLFYEPRLWNPLTDDGDALRLATQLKMCVSVNDENTSIDCSEGWVAIQQAHQSDPVAATRRAITRAAASIGAAGGDGS